MKAFNRTISAVLMTALLVSVMAICPVSADGYKSGDPMGDVLYTNVVAYIDGYPIRSYNIAGNTYVVAEDLMEYGFGVTWDGATSRLVISTERTATPDKYTTKYQPTANTGTPGMPAMKYVYTEVTTWIDNTQINGYNIGGYTCICMDDLATYFAEVGGYVWDAPTSTLRLTTKLPIKHDPNAKPVELEMSDADLKEFVKNLNGNHSLIASIGHKFELTNSDYNFTMNVEMDDRNVPTLTSIEGFSGKIRFAKAPKLTGDWNVFENFYFNILGGSYAMNHLVVHTNYENGIGDNYLYFNGMMTEWHDVPGQQNDAVSLYKENDYLVGYTRRAGKYTSADIASRGFAAVAEKITSRNDFYDEKGYVLVVEGELSYTSDVVRTISDVYDLDAEYAKLRAADSTLPATIDELIERNLAK